MPIKTVLLDAFGTLIYPKQSIAQIYRDVALRHGIDQSIVVIENRFGPAFQNYFRTWKSIKFPEHQLDSWQNRWLSDPAGTIEQWGEQQHNQWLKDLVQPCQQDGDAKRWRELIDTVFPSAAVAGKSDLLFESLWNEFANPEVWRIDDQIESLMAWAKTNHIVLAIASNFDSRLRSIIAGFPVLESMNQIFVSTELGFAKPSPRFYYSILDRLGQEAAQVVMVGDSWCEDVAVPTAMGIRSFWLHTSDASNENLISNLGQLPHRISPINKQ